MIVTALNIIIIDTIMTAVYPCYTLAFSVMHMHIGPSDNYATYLICIVEQGDSITILTEFNRIYTVNVD